MSRRYKDNLDELVRARYENKCCNCGATENLNIHHIVPIKRGGVDSLNNLVLVCQKCHQGIHYGQNVALYRDHSNDGRKRINEDDNIYREFLHGAITGREAAQKLGYSDSSHIADMPGYRDFKKREGIKSVVRKGAKGQSRSKIYYTDGRVATWCNGFLLEDGKVKL